MTSLQRDINVGFFPFPFFVHGLCAFCIPYFFIISVIIKLMPGGDLYEISDNGATLSGGQRTRVALARALYQV